MKRKAECKLTVWMFISTQIYFMFLAMSKESNTLIIANERFLLSGVMSVVWLRLEIH